MTNPTLRVRDYMTTDPVTVRSDVEITRAVHSLVEHDVSGMPVVDADGYLVGILTERDCIRVTLEAGYHDEAGGPVSRFMTTDVRTMHPDDSLVDAAELFADAPIRRCPVVADGRLVGLICRRDVLRALTRHPWFAAPEGSHANRSTQEKS